MLDLLAFPDNAAVNKQITKKKLFEWTQANTTIKNLFAAQVERIIWAYKLSPETINLSSKEGIEEIQIFEIFLKGSELNNELLKTIDKAIPSPIFFVIYDDQSIQYRATYKRVSDADSTKWLVGDYFESAWIIKRYQKSDLPQALDLKSLYYSLLQALIPLTKRQDESIEQLLTRYQALNQLERKSEQLQKRLHQEKQFNYKVEINAQLRDVKKQIEQLRD
ncbi:DUF4391 domain-containing protein [Fluoribacter gormanii]|uniref:Methyl-accepting chemotaxis protein n=1 Tax=Fluoribacter gormanii TaxID=464 RepID=A0A377GG32_9GAMM|nr:DUF4391 domain-containing protein [Fluoribacter gormanii]KTD02762.1 hypothetical protein Lgor_1639 [Fluoribacter gormanii]SIR59028.1 protein of unknown function [Fluoribacter gormanii]STO23779.1 Uncharacterised protein [Fluoribacter gormanii]